MSDFDLTNSELALIASDLSDEQLVVLWTVVREEMWERKHLAFCENESKPRCQTCGTKHPKERGCRS